MPRNVRTISVNLNAGTAAFFKDLDAASGKLRQFGHEGVSNVQATSGALRVLEGSMTNNLRAAERFVANILGLGPILRAAFPLVGAVALGGLLGELGEKAYKFYASIRDAGEKSAGAFRELAAPLRLTNEELAVANDRLANEIAKLEGHHENTAKLALDEARLATDKLADSLDKALINLHKVLDEQNVGYFRQLFLNEGGTKDIQEELGGKTGYGGFDARLAGIRQNSSPADFAAQATTAIQEEIAKFDRMIADAREKAKPIPQMNEFGGPAVPLPGMDESARLEQLNAAKSYLQEELEHIRQQVQNTSLTGQRDKLQAAKENAQQDKPFNDRMKAIAAQIEGLQARFAAIGQDETGQAIAKGFADAQKAIEETNKALERHNKQLTEAQKQQIIAKSEAASGIEAETAWRTKYEQTTLSIDERIEATNRLTQAIGKGYAATKEASVQSGIVQAMGDRANQPQYASESLGLRQKLEAEYDAQHARSAAESVQKLNEQIDLERVLAAAQKLGAEAVREATLAMKLRQMTAEGATHAQIQAEIELFNAQRQNAQAGDLSKINERIEATQRMTQAILQSAAAERVAAIENKVTEAARGGASADDVSRMRKEASDEYAQSLARLSVDADRTRALGDQIQKLQDAKTLYGDTLAIEIQLRDLENQRIHALAEESLGLRGARDGVRAFFIEMQTDAESAAKIVYDSLNSAVDRVSENLGKLFTGHKTDWAKSFQQLGEQMTQESVKSLLHTGLGTLGKLFGVDVGQGKPDGTVSNPIWVRMAEAHFGERIGSMDRTIAGLPAGLGGGRIPGVPSGVFQGGSGMVMSLLKAFGMGGAGGEKIGSLDRSIGMDPNSLGELASNPFFGGARASGGEVDPGHVYWVGENGREPFIPSTPGTILPHGSLGGQQVTYQIDARGADLGAYNRIQRGIEMSHKAAVSTAVQAMHEHSKRVPSR